MLVNFGFSGSISLPYFNDMPKMVGVNQTMDMPEKIDLVVFHDGPNVSRLVLRVAARSR